MPTYMIQFAYNPDSVKAMIAKPQDRRQAAEALISAAGGRLLDMYFSFGDYDGVGIAEFPSNVEAASASLAIGGSGGFSKVKSTVLITMEESVEAMKKAGGVAGSYSPPGA